MATDIDDKITYQAMRDYIKTLYEAKAVNDAKMKFYYYEPIEKLMVLWKLNTEEN